MRARLVAVAALSAALLGAAPTLAQPGHQPGARAGTLSVVAAHNATVQWRLRAPAHLDGDAYDFELPDSVVKASGSYGGVLIYKGRELMFALLKDRDLPAPLVFGAPVLTLRPGTYTVMVAGDGPVSVHLPLHGSRYSYDLRATAGAHVRRASVRTDKSLSTSAATGNVGYSSQPMHLPQGSAIVLAYVVRSNSSQLTKLDLCLMPEDAPCQPNKEVEGLDGIGGSVGAIGEGWQEAAMFAYPGDIPAGHYFEVGDHADVSLASTGQLVGYVFG